MTLEVVVEVAKQRRFARSPARRAAGSQQALLGTQAAEPQPLRDAANGDVSHRCDAARNRDSVFVSKRCGVDPQPSTNSSAARMVVTRYKHGAPPFATSHWLGRAVRHLGSRSAVGVPCHIQRGPSRPTSEDWTAGERRALDAGPPGPTPGSWRPPSRRRHDARQRDGSAASACVLITDDRRSALRSGPRTWSRRGRLLRHVIDSSIERSSFYHVTRNPNCMLLASSAVVMTPAVGFEMLLSGVPKFVWFRRLKISPRNSSRAGPIGNRLVMEKSTR